LQCIVQFSGGVFLGRRFCCPTGSAVVESFYQFSILLFEKLHAIMLLVLILLSFVVVVVVVGWGRVVSLRGSSYGRTKRNMLK
jgi:hypothetical protein